MMRWNFETLIGFTVCSILLIFISGHLIFNRYSEVKTRVDNVEKNDLILESALDFKEIYREEERFKYNDISQADIAECSMQNCFDLSKCLYRPFKVYLYPQIDPDQPFYPGISERYAKILDVIRNSPYFTDDPAQACLFVLTYDTLDRDVLSENYLRSLQQRINMLPTHLWNGGTNHVIFNLYHGTWPNYTETELRFYPGNAILAKASFSLQHYRAEFDVSLPLFHDQLPARLQNFDDLQINEGRRAYLLGFKGKRYVFGIGSETRNSLRHLHNGKDIIAITTCRHGRQWKEMQDEFCEHDNELFDQWDYQQLLLNATFCLIPRGRRLGSFRFLEALQTGCIPVFLSNEWVVPFQEIIDWSKASIWADERLLFQVPEMVLSVPKSKVFAMRQQAQKLYRFYFSSVETIVSTTFEIIKSRIEKWKGGNYDLWNFHGGSPIAAPACAVDESVQCKVVVFVKLQQHDVDFDLIDSTLNRCEMVKKIIFISNDDRISYRNDVLIISISDKKILNWVDFASKHATVDDAILWLSTAVIFSSSICEEIEFSMKVWRNFRDRLIGFYGRTHFYDTTLRQWRYSTATANHVSMLSDAFLVFSSRLAQNFINDLYPSIRELLFQQPHCHSIVFNMFVSKLTRQPPILLGKTSRHSSQLIDENEELFSECLNAATKSFGGVPLMKTWVRFDPILFADPVDVNRKKYSNLESGTT